MAIIRSREDIETLLGGPTSGEATLLEACLAGAPCVLGDDTLPGGDAGPDRQVRAAVLRYLILGGCVAMPVPGRGVDLSGALILGSLDLSFQTACGIVDLTRCRFAAPVEALQFQGASLNLTGSALLGLNAQGAEIRGDVFLNRTTVMGETSFAGATIGGQLSCLRARLSAKGRTALNLQGAEIRDGLFWRDGATCEAGEIDLTAARIPDLADDLTCWPEAGNLTLNGLTYERVYGELDVKPRLRWLAAGSYAGPSFRPQPYTHLARLYREMGRDGEARRVLIERQRLEWQDLRRRMRKPGDRAEHWLPLPIRLGWTYTVDWISRYGVGYGFAPQRAFYALLVVWAIGWGLSVMAWQSGAMAPNSGPVQVSAAWQAMVTCTQDCPANPAQAWSAPNAPGQDWETFNALAYSADLVIPLIDLNQTDAWAPSPARGGWGTALWAGGFVLHILGWVITALGAAAVTGIIRRD